MTDSESKRKSIDELIADEHSRHARRMESLIPRGKAEEIHTENERYQKRIENLVNRRDSAMKRKGNLKKVHDDAVKIRMGGILCKYFPELYRLDHTHKKYFAAMDDYFGKRLDALKSVLSDLQEAIDREQANKPK